MLNEQQRKLVESNIKLAKSLAWKLSRNNKRIPLEDIEQLCFEGLCNAANGFDETKGYRFSTYAYVAMKRNYFKHTAYKKEIPTISLDASSYEDDRDDGTILNFIDGADETNMETYASTRIMMDYQRFISKQTPHRQRIMNMTLGGMNLREISAVLGCSTQNVSVAQIKMRKEFKRWLN